ncbi:MAG: hypothetical protein ACXQTY_01755, partial [Candidatus Methanogasteraceae archaeon]
QLHNSPLPGWVWGSVLRWWLAFPQAGFSPAGEYEFISALLCTLWQYDVYAMKIAVYAGH